MENKEHALRGNTPQTKRKARIIRYWQVVDENNSTIDDAQNYKTERRIMKMKTNKPADCKRMKCNDCEETELGSCEECADEFKLGDRIVCGTLGRHWHRDCLGQPARIIK